MQDHRKVLMTEGTDRRRLSVMSEMKIVKITTKYKETRIVFLWKIDKGLVDKKNNSRYNEAI